MATKKKKPATKSKGTKSKASTKRKGSFSREGGDAGTKGTGSAG